MTYPQAIQYLESFINYEKIPAYPYRESLKLGRVSGFLEAIDNPQDSLRCIHVAGTKGKGSTCAFLTYILREAGYKVGLYTSPHLSDFRERIRILRPQTTRPYRPQTFEGMISKDELAELTERLKPLVEKYNKNSKYGPLSFFEVYTALAFVYFKEKQVDFAVLETGLGGRLDATNVVSPLVCAITPISYEHTQKLGNTLKQIAREKAGIIKIRPKTTGQRLQLIVISAPQEKAAGEVIRHRCKESGVKLYEISQNRYPRFKIKLLGEHQQVNARVAQEVIKALRFYQIKINRETMRKGLYNTVWPGRCEVISRNPLVVLDGAQNVASSKALKKTIKESFKYKKLILVLGISSDKDIPGICSQLYDLADVVILTQANNPRATKPEVLTGYFKDKDTHTTTNITEAKVLASRIAQKEDLILVTGSLFVVGEFRHLAGPVLAVSRRITRLEISQATR